MDLTKTEERKSQRCDTGLQCLITVANTLGIAVDESKIAVVNNDKAVLDTKALLETGKGLKLKVELKSITQDSLQAVEIPAIAVMKDGNYVVIGKNDAKHILLFDPLIGRTETLVIPLFLEKWSGKVITVKPGFSIKNIINKYNLFWFIPIVVKYKKVIIEVFLASFVLQLFGVIMPLFTQVILDKVIVSKGTVTLDVLGIALLIVAVFQLIMGVLRIYLSNHTANKLDMLFGARLFYHLISLPLRYFELRRVGDTLTRLAVLDSIREFFTGSALTVLLDTIFSVVFITLMLYFNVQLTLVALSVLPFYLLQNVIATPIFREKLEKVWAAGAESNAFLVEVVTGMHTIKSLALEPQFNYRWGNLIAKYVSTAFSSAKFNIIIGSTGNLIQSLTGFAILLFGGHKVMNGEMTIGQLVAFQMLASQAGAPIQRLTSMWQSIQQTALSLERIGDILKTQPERIAQDNNSKLAKLNGDIAFENVTFRYRPDGQPVLNNVNIQIAAGMKVGIVGPSGSGKSTLTKLLQCLYLPESGQVLVDGQDAGCLAPHWLRKQLGVVLQENLLFTGSVRQNISFARPSASIYEVIEAATLAGAHEFILELTEGYDTMVGERGTALSGGQQQRIAIARTLLANPSIIIFDEATSALDYESERIIMENFNKIAVGRTIMMIAHRLSTVKKCDLIIVLDKGMVVEQGSHEELMAYQGLYHNLYMRQEV